MRGPKLPDLTDPETPEIAADDGEIESAPRLLHPHRRPAVQRKDLRAPLAAREWAMLRRIATAIDMPMTSATRHCIRLAYEAMFGPPTVATPRQREDDAA